MWQNIQHRTPYCLYICPFFTISRLAQTSWTSYQIRKTVGCACAGNTGNVFPHRRLVGHVGIAYLRWIDPGIPGAYASAILRIWQEAHANMKLNVALRMNGLFVRGSPGGSASQKASNAVEKRKLGVCVRMAPTLRLIWLYNLLWTALLMVYKPVQDKVKIWLPLAKKVYRQTSSISHSLVGNKFVDHSDVVGTSPVGDSPTTSSYSTKHVALMDRKQRKLQYEREIFKFGDLVRLSIEILRYAAKIYHMAVNRLHYIRDILRESIR